MNERELERVMRDFTAQRANLLLCTTIIETGIDNPHANTIVINRADTFGLAQLHQLRGRVGRSHHQAYAYLLTHADADGQSGLTKQARQRLEAIQILTFSESTISRNTSRAKNSVPREIRIESSGMRQVILCKLAPMSPKASRKRRDSPSPR
jgi:superfamily II DNA or RNA helicase